MGSLRSWEEAGRHEYKGTQMFSDEGIEGQKGRRGLQGRGNLQGGKGLKKRTPSVSSKFCEELFRTRKK